MSNGSLSSASFSGLTSSFVATANGSYVIPGVAVVTDNSGGGGGGVIEMRRTLSPLGTRAGSRQLMRG